MLGSVILYYMCYVKLLKYINLRRAGAGEVDVPRRRVPGAVVALPPPEASK